MQFHRNVVDKFMNCHFGSYTGHYRILVFNFDYASSFLCQFFTCKMLVIIVSTKILNFQWIVLHQWIRKTFFFSRTCRESYFSFMILIKWRIFDIFPFMDNLNDLQNNPYKFAIYGHMNWRRYTLPLIVSYISNIIQ